MEVMHLWCIYSLISRMPPGRWFFVSLFYYYSTSFSAWDWLLIFPSRGCLPASAAPVETFSPHQAIAGVPLQKKIDELRFSPCCQAVIVNWIATTDRQRSGGNLSFMGGWTEERREAAAATAANRSLQTLRRGEGAREPFVNTVERRLIDDA